MVTINNSYPGGPFIVIGGSNEAYEDIKKQYPNRNIVHIQPEEIMKMINEHPEYFQEEIAAFLEHQKGSPN